MRRTKDDAEQTRLKVIEAALKLFSKQGYSKTTLAMIAEAAGCSRGPIYWHFRNKDELYEAVLRYSQEPLEALTAKALSLIAVPEEGLRAFVEGWFDLLITDAWHRQSFEILLNKTELTEAVAQTLERERQLAHTIVDALTQLIEQARAHSHLPAGEPARQLGLYMYLNLMGITHTWLFAPSLFSLKTEKNYFVQKCMQTLGMKSAHNQK